MRLKNVRSTHACFTTIHHASNIYFSEPQLMNSAPGRYPALPPPGPNKHAFRAAHNTHPLRFPRRAGKGTEYQHRFPLNAATKPTHSALHLATPHPRPRSRSRRGTPQSTTRTRTSRFNTALLAPPAPTHRGRYAATKMDTNAFPPVTTAARMETDACFCCAGAGREGA